MQNILELLQQRDTIKRPRSSREDAINAFVTMLQRERGDTTHYKKDGKWKKLTPITPKFVALRLRFVKDIDDLRYLYSKCKQSRSFSQTFFWMTQTKVIKEN